MTGEQLRRARLGERHVDADGQRWVTLIVPVESDDDDPRRTDAGEDQAARPARRTKRGES